MTLIIFTCIAFICEWIDASLGMGFGTILSPLLIACGFDPLVVVPSILIAQAAGGFIASRFHHHYGNADFGASSNASKSTWIISLCGIFATIIASIISINLPTVYLKAYIGGLVTTMGVLILLNLHFQFTWKKMIGIGLLSAFNKGISGGGFGPVVTAGQIMIGKEYKEAIAITTFAEAPICIASFLTYLALHGLTDWTLPVALSVGAAVAGPFGAYTTAKLKQHLHVVVGILILILGLLTLTQLYYPNLKIGS